MTPSLDVHDPTAPVPGPGAAGGLGALGPVGQALARTLEADRLSASYLFEGADAADVREAALLFAREILAAAAPAGGAARARLRAAGGAHADLHVQERDKATVISVAALTALLERAHASPLEGRRQVMVVDPADAMEPEAMGRYLKALEEPPGGTVFLLCSTRPERLPETVLSRCQRVRLVPLAAGETAARLVAEGMDGERARALGRWAGGSASRARRMAQAEVDAAAQRLSEAVAGPRAEPVRAALDALGTLERGAAGMAAAEAAGSRREAVRALLGDLLHVFAVEARDRAAGREAPMLPEAGPDEALRLLERLGTLSAAVASNVTPAVVIIETALALGEVRAPPPAP